MKATENHTDEQHAHQGHYDGHVILFISFSLLVGCAIKVLISQTFKNRVPIPFTVLLLLFGFVIGICIGNHSPTNDFLLSEYQLSHINPHLVFYIFLPLLIFDSAFNCNFNVIRHQIVPGILLAGPGVFVSVGLVAIFSVYVFPYKWTWIESLMFGSILSATDPVAIVALLHESGAGKALAAIIDMESLLNDGSAFVIFMIFRDIVVKNATSAKKIVKDIFKFTLGGPAFGLACGIVAVFILDLVNNNSEVEIISTFGISYLVFYIADFEMEVSAVLALVVMGLFMAKHKYCISSHVQGPIANIWEIIVYFANILIFIITGLILGHSIMDARSHIGWRDFGYSIILYLVLHLARFLAILILLPFIMKSGSKFSWKEYLMLWWSGLRGSMSVILALMVKAEEAIPEETRNRMLFQICMIALFTLTINGTSSKMLVPLLGLNHGTQESEKILSQAMEHLHLFTAASIEKMKGQKPFAEVDWEMLYEYLPHRIVEKFDVKRNSSIHRHLSKIDSQKTKSSPLSPNVPESELPELKTFEIIDMFDENTLSDIGSEERGRPSKTNFVLHEIKPLLSDTKKELRIRDEFMQRFLSAMSFDYETQWYYGMIRRKTLTILNISIEEARQHNSLKVHWESVVRKFRWPLSLRILSKFDRIPFFKRIFDRLLFDRVFLITELILAFHEACDRVNTIQTQFPELCNIDRKVWGKVCDEAKIYHQLTAYILLDIQRCYRRCWRLQITKRCAQIVLKFESDTANQLRQTGILCESEYAHIEELIEKKLFNLEFYRVRLPKGESKMIPDGFELLKTFEALSKDELERWANIFKARRRCIEPRGILFAYGETIRKAFWIARGIVECDSDHLPIYFRSGTILGVDLLFDKKGTSPARFMTTAVLVEGYDIDDELLEQLLDDDHVAPKIYRKIASETLMNRFRKETSLRRKHLKVLLKSKAKFYRKQNETIELKEGDRFLLLRGIVRSVVDRDFSRFDAIHLQVMKNKTKLVFDDNTILFTWTADDELYCLDNRDQMVELRPVTNKVVFEQVSFPRHSEGFSNYPRRQTFSGQNYSNDFSNRRVSMDATLMME